MSEKQSSAAATGAQTAPDERPDKAKLPAKAWVRPIARLLLFPVALLWPAGTWQWWEAWAVVGLWFSFAIASSVFLSRHDPELLAERMKGSPTQEGQKAWDKLLMLLIFAAGLGIFIVPGLDVKRFAWSETLPTWLEILAMAAHVPSFLCIGWVMHANTYLSKVVKIAEDRGHHVITTGPYALVRHPMYTAVIVLVIALPVALGSRFGLIPGTLLAAAILVRTYLEDRTLYAELAGYPEYARETRYRLIPGIW
jgi:protein-S-isoprenylcysteine O-methyltransferase Ste14